MKLFVLFLILTLYSAKQRVYVSLFFPINIIFLLGKPLSEKISSVKGKNQQGGNPNFQNLGGSFEGGMKNSSFR